MNEEKTKDMKNTINKDEHVADMEAHDVIEIKEFVVSSDKARSERKRAEMASVNAFAIWSPKKKGIAVLILFIIAALIYALVGILNCQINPAIVCMVLIIQVGIGVLLDQNPVWLHGLVAIADVIVGVFIGQVVFMVFAMLIYVTAIATLEVLQRLHLTNNSDKKTDR